MNAVNEILRHIDFPAVIHSCNSGNQQLAKRVLCQLHCAFVEVYGTDFIKQPLEQFVNVPAVVRGRRNGILTLGLAVCASTESRSNEYTGDGRKWKLTYFSPTISGVYQ